MLLIERREGAGGQGEGRGERREEIEERGEGRWQRAEGRGQRAEGRGQRAEGRGQRAEGRGENNICKEICQFCRYMENRTLVNCRNILLYIVSKVKVDNVACKTVISHLCFAGCSDPGFKKNTIFTPKPYATTMGESVHVSCKAGYHFAQSEHAGNTEVKMTCTYKGWNVKQVPQCKRK